MGAATAAAMAAAKLKQEMDMQSHWVGLSNSKRKESSGNTAIHIDIGKYDTIYQLIF